MMLQKQRKVTLFFFSCCFDDWQPRREKGFLFSSQFKVQPIVLRKSKQKGLEADGPTEPIVSGREGGMKCSRASPLLCVQSRVLGEESGPAYSCGIRFKMVPFNLSFYFSSRTGPRTLCQQSTLILSYRTSYRLTLNSRSSYLSFPSIQDYKPGTHYVDQVTPELRDLPASSSQVLRLKEYTTLLELLYQRSAC